MLYSEYCIFLQLQFLNRMDLFHTGQLVCEVISVQKFPRNAIVEEI